MKHLFKAKVLSFLALILTANPSSTIIEKIFLFRQNLFTAWKHHLDMANITYRSELARTEFLSDPDQRLQWQSHSLPTDDLCTENAIMLSR